MSGSSSTISNSILLSVAVKKLEDELDIKLFERSASEVAVTPLGDDIVRQAQVVLEQARVARWSLIRPEGGEPASLPVHLTARAEGRRQGIEEAAFIDGCGEFGVVRYVTFPLVMPGILISATFAFILSASAARMRETSPRGTEVWHA